MKKDREACLKQKKHEEEQTKRKKERAKKAELKEREEEVKRCKLEAEMQHAELQNEKEERRKVSKFFKLMLPKIHCFFNRRSKKLKLKKGKKLKNES